MPINIVISTGAGISAESGVHTYRDKSGLWTKYNPEIVSSVSGWLEHPEQVLGFKNDLRRQFAEHNYQPNAAHLALTRLQKEWKHGEVTIITQNIDGLHAAAGSQVIEMHGNNREKICEACYHKSDYVSDIVHTDPCVACGSVGTTRPWVVLFGEIPNDLQMIDWKLKACGIFAVIGSSLEVSPGNQFVYNAREVGAETYYLNKDKPSFVNLRPYRNIEYGLATEIVPAWVDKLLSKYGR